MNVTMVLTAMVNSGGSAFLVVLLQLLVIVVVIVFDTVDHHKSCISDM